MWGSENSIRTIEIDGITISVRENLWHALCHLRPDTCSKVMWIDAVCIDQDNHEEKGHQVEQMGKIYGQATRVIVWLGLSDANSQLAFQVLSDIKHWGPLLKPPVDLPAEAIVNANLTALLSVCRRGYWNRLWIIQEVLMARNLVLQCGKSSCTWLRLAWLFGALLNFNKTYRLDAHALHGRDETIKAIQRTIPTSLVLQRQYQNDNHLGALKYKPYLCPLLGLFEEFGEAECHDLRDRIFGLQSMAELCCREAVPVDYSLTWADIYEKLLEHYILHHEMKTPRLFRNWSEVGILPDPYLIRKAQKLQIKFGVTLKYCVNTKRSSERIITAINHPQQSHHGLRQSQHLLDTPADLFCASAPGYRY